MPQEVELSSRSAVYIKGLLEEQMQGQSSLTNVISGLVCSYLMPNLSELFSELYLPTFSPSIDSLDEANVFLLAEVHDHESSWRKLNGKFISYLTLFYPVVVFVEGIGALEIPGVQLEQEIRKVYQINAFSPVNFYGWDLNNDSTEELLKNVARIDVLKSEKIKLRTKIKASRSFQKQRGLKRKKEDLDIEYWKVIDLVIELSQRTFPGRTKSMVSVLEGIRQGTIASVNSQTKFVFVAGLDHLKENGRHMDFSLAPLKRELAEQKSAVILIPALEEAMNL